VRASGNWGHDLGFALATWFSLCSHLQHGCAPYEECIWGGASWMGEKTGLAGLRGVDLPKSDSPRGLPFPLAGMKGFRVYVDSVDLECVCECWCEWLRAWAYGDKP
jgi:hypothetical protein